MPTYEYTCLKCEHDFEVFQSMKDAPLKICSCGKKGKVRRKIGGGAGIIFKGSGFYQTDYKSSKSPDKAVGEKPKETAAKTESKPAASTESKSLSVRKS